jgi:glycosyltransferase involved in cell wall biosynthesis
VKAYGKVALVHDYLNQYGGAERVLEALHDLFPEAPVYTSVFDAETMPAHYRTWDVRTSWMQRLPFWRRHSRKYFLLYPSAFEAFDLSGYDLIVSSSSAYAKGIIPAPGTTHVCYCHTPMRFGWRTADYVKREGISPRTAWLLSLSLTYLRMWDVTSTARVDAFAANSEEVAARIRRYYNRDAAVIPPPVELPPYVETPPEEYYLTGGRLVPYKRVDVVVEAFTTLGLPLKVFGDGRDRARLESIAGSNVEFLGHVPEAELGGLYRGCRAYVTAGEEDAGIQPLEAMAAGRPVVAFAAGGLRESVVDGTTGCFFDEQTAPALTAAVQRSQAIDFDAQQIRVHAESFGRERFQTRILGLIDSAREASG